MRLVLPVVPVVPILAAVLAAAPALAAPVEIAIVGTTDVHGHLEAVRSEARLPDGRTVKVERGGSALLGGYLGNLRRTHPGRVLLVDSGDMMQGTMVSNLGEGHAVVEAMNALGYQAAAVGNHEFDFGPVGPHATPALGPDGKPAEDPRGALLARAAEARFPWLSANVRDRSTGRPFGAPTIRDFTVVTVAGVRVGLVGVTSEDTPRTTNRRNLVGLEVERIVPSVVRAAKAARAAGAQVIVLLAHAGGECKRFDRPDDSSTCMQNAEIFQVARALPPGTVSAIFAGHTHQGVAQVVAGIPIAQSFSYDFAFSRIDLTVDDGRVVAAKIHPPTEICGEVWRGTESCLPERAHGALEPARYEGLPVVADEKIAASFQGDVERARAAREEKVGVVLDTALPRAHREESPLGNLVADALREATPGADIGMTNGGGLRADLPAGELRWGALFEALPFDNKLAVVKVRGATLEKMVRANLAGAKGILSVSGMRARATCDGAELRVAIEVGGKPLDAKRVYTIATSDFLALGGDDFGQVVPTLPRGAVNIDEEGQPLRDLVAARLRLRGHVSASDPAIFDPAHPRIALPARRPFRCPVGDGGAASE